MVNFESLSACDMDIEKATWKVENGVIWDG